jgi:hypothetical protein
MLIRVDGDSLSMPRATEEILFRDTYPELLRMRIETSWPNRRVCLYNRSRGGATIRTLLEDFRTDSFFFGKTGGDLLIIQAGVVDCAPRPVLPLLRRGIGLLPPRPKARAIRFLHDNRAAILRRGFGSRATRPRPFGIRYAEWLAQAREEFTWVYALNIAPTNPYIEERSPGFGASVAAYNALIDQACASAGPNVRVIDVHRAISREPDGVSRYINARDGHHITVAGHQLYCNLIMEHLPEDFHLADRE